jgi:hypothetical protein
MTLSLWRERAACAGVERPERFDAPSTWRISTEVEAAAGTLIAQFCARCPVAKACLDDALATHATGIRGGRLITTEHGSISAYNRHKKAGEDACAECLEAARAYGADRRDPILPIAHIDPEPDAWAIEHGYQRLVSA